MADLQTSELKTLPLDALHRELGARMVPFAGHHMPVSYPAGVMAEHRWTRQSAGLFDVSHMGQLHLSGEGADQWLETLVPGDIIGLKSSVMRYTMLLNEAGGILDDLMVTRTDEGLFLVVNGATCIDDLAFLRERLPQGLELRHDESSALLALQGPEAEAVLEKLVAGVSTLKFMRAGQYDSEFGPLLVTRSGYTGEDGFEISLAADRSEEFARLLLSDERVKPVGLGARDSLRLEAGLPLYGHDLTPDITPVEAGLSFAISKRRKTEGGFPAADLLLKQLLDGPEVKRVGLKLDGAQPVREGAPILAGGEVVGRVTSGGFGPTVEAPIAMGYVPPAHGADGTALEVEVRGKRLPARVVPMPFWQKNYVR